VTTGIVVVPEWFFRGVVGNIPGVGGAGHSRVERARPLPLDIGQPTGDPQERADMTYYVVKVVISALLIVAISEVAKRSSFAGGLIASLPVVSILAFVWLYLDTRDAEKVAALSRSIFWLVLPSLSLFLVLPWALKRTDSFYVGLGLSIAAMLGLYAATVLVLKRFDIEL
jgi:F0F1-type ATP synthase assembly protein I